MVLGFHHIRKHLDQNLDKGSRQLQNKIIKDIRDYERTTLNKLQKHIMMPLDKLFINVGNDALKLFNELLDEMEALCE